jgi:hypothetical protein
MRGDCFFLCGGSIVIEKVYRCPGREKLRSKGIEKDYQCPMKRKKRAQGNREGPSMPEEEKNSGSRESRRLIDAREGENFWPKGIENVYRCPRRRKKLPNGN